MIERLTNCPTCGGILNEAGRCRFCGSKVYDFLTIDFSEKNYPSARTYIRIKVNGKIVLAPVIIDNVSMTTEPLYYDFPCENGSYLKRMCPRTSLDMHCLVVDKVYQFEEVDNDN